MLVVFLLMCDAGNCPLSFFDDVNSCVVFLLQRQIYAVLSVEKFGAEYPGVFSSSYSLRQYEYVTCK